jgi:hypothetical protein
MTSQKYSIAIAALALIASACAQTQSSTRQSVHVPAGQAAQPWSWNQPEQSVVSLEGCAGGRDAQPWSGPVLKPAGGASTWQYAAGVPSGRAAQPGGWSKSVQ